MLSLFLLTDSFFFHTYSAIRYAVKTTSPPQQNKINCWEKEKETETENLFSYWRSVRRWAARTEEHSCGGRLSDPLPSASPEPMPSCAESVTKQASRNTGQAVRCSRWAPPHYFLRSSSANKTNAAETRRYMTTSSTSPHQTPTPHPCLIPPPPPT